MEERISRRFCEKFIEPSDLTKVEKKKVEYGLSIILINFLKFIVVYSVAIFLGGVIDTIIVHISFLFVRRYSYGYHANKSSTCTVMAILLFAVIPYLIANIAYNFSLINIVLNTIMVLAIIFVLSPQVTKNNIVKDYKDMKIKSMLTSTVVALAILGVPNKTVKLLLLFSLSIVAFTLAASFLKKERI